MKRISSYFMPFGLALSFFATLVGCKDDEGGNSNPFIFQPINIEYSLDDNKMSETYNMVSYQWEDRTESPATHYIVTTYQGLKSAGGKAIATTKKVTHDDTLKAYTAFVDEALLSGTIYEVEITPYMNKVKGHAATLIFESAINDIVGASTKVATTSSSATFNWMPIGKGIPRKIIVTPIELNPNVEDEALEVEQDIAADVTSVAVEGLVSFTKYSAKLIDMYGGIVGKYELTTSMAGGIIVYNNEELKSTIESLAQSGGAIQLSTQKGTKEFEYIGDLPASTNAFYLMGSEDFENPDSIATVKLSVQYMEGSGPVYIMRLNIDGKNDADVKNFVTLKAADNPQNLTQGKPAISSGIYIQDCSVSNYAGSFLLAPGNSYHQLETFSVTNTHVSNIVGNLIYTQAAENPSFITGDNKLCGSAIKNIIFDGVTIYNVANEGGDYETYTRGTALFRFSNVSGNNSTKGSFLHLNNSTLISVAPEGEIFLVEDYNYQGKDYPGGVFVKDCLFVDISDGSMATRTGQTANGNNFNPSSNQSANASSMLGKTSVNSKFGANSNTGKYPLCGPQVSVEFKDLAKLDFTIVGGTATKGNPALYK